MCYIEETCDDEEEEKDEYDDSTLISLNGKPNLGRREMKQQNSQTHQYAKRISLLKIDVEGSELHALESK